MSAPPYMAKPPRWRGWAKPQPLPGRGPPVAAPGLPPLDLRLLAELPSLTLQARYVVEGFLSGRHHTWQKGSSVEFAEYRAYQLGDDLRRVDWRLYGRTGRLHVKQYEDETQLRLFVVLDVSGSMNYQSRPQVMRKVEYARIALAALARLAQRQGDAFGLGVAGAELSDFLRARSSLLHWGVFVGRLENVAVGGPTALALALEELAEVAPTRSLIVIASDFYEELELLETALHRLRYEHHDIIGLHVLDPIEMEFEVEESGAFIDAENGARLKLDGPAARRGYLERFGKFCADLDDLFWDAGGDIARLRTDQPPVAALTHYLARRESRL